LFNAEVAGEPGIDLLERVYTVPTEMNEPAFFDMLDGIPKRERTKARLDAELEKLEATDEWVHDGDNEHLLLATEIYAQEAAATLVEDGYVCPSEREIEEMSRAGQAYQYSFEPCHLSEYRKGSTVFLQFPEAA